MAGPLKCPGQDQRSLTVSLHPCPQCGYAVEIFSDEMRRRCPKCGVLVLREDSPSCVSWCSSARQCLGEERWQQLMGPEGPAEEK